MVEKKKTGAAKVAPKGDTTQKRRQSKRMERLNAEARLKGWKGISEYLTAVIKHEAELPEKMSWADTPERK